MLIDFRDADAPVELRSDVCIVGAGPAGIALALALAQSRLDVCVVESGGLEIDLAVQELCDGERLGLQNADPLGCRIRALGGTTARWQGWCAPLSDVDFEARPWVPHSGWPIGKRDLDPYYALAWSLCEVQPDGESALRAAMPPFDPDKLRTGLWHFSPPTRFGTTYRERLNESARVRVLLNCTAIRLDTDRTASELRAIQIAALTGKQGRIRANTYVLACGGMENARVLTLANDVLPEGLGNRSGALGRYFTQHIETVVARAHVADAAGVLDAFQRSSTGTARAHVTISPEMQRSQTLLDTGFAFGRPEAFSSGYRALQAIWHSIAKGHLPEDFADKVWSVATDMDEVAHDVVTRNEAPQYLNLGVYAEQSPNFDSRVALSDAKDAFGLPKIEVDWRLSPRDRRSIARATQIVAEELGRLRLGRLKLADWLVADDAPWPQPLWGGCHHMGTTRMSEDPDVGVVDSDCRVHGVANLYVTGSSVFPTGGYVPPTLTILAMALRLADHLAQRHA